MSSSELVIADSPHYQNMDRVATLSLQGWNPTQIARETGIKRKDVIALQDEWKETMSFDQAAKDRVHDALNVLDTHYNALIKQAYSALDQIETDMNNSGTTHQMVTAKLKAVALISDLESKRLDALQKSGLLDAADMGDQVAEVEKRQEQLVEILRNDLCDKCRIVVNRKLQVITKKVEVVQVHD